jgi:mono/diheme cytochrome c family protein
LRNGAVGGRKSTRSPTILRAALVGLFVALGTAGMGAGQVLDGRPSVALPEAPVRSLLTGYKRYNAFCGHCHGPDGLGSTFAPSLVSRPSDLPNFRAVVADGIGAKMPGYGSDPNVAPYIEDIYRYLRARAEGHIGRGRPAERHGPGR